MARPGSGGPLAVPVWALWVVSALCIYMIFHMLVMPQSYSQAVWLKPDSQLARMIQEHADRNEFPLPSDVITKYQGQLVIVMFHQLPGMVWSAAIPWQLRDDVRSRTPGLHRLAGYAVAVSGALVSVGPVLMEVRGLSSASPWWHATWIFRGALAWFVFTLVRAITAAVGGRYSEHRAWALRHMGAGLWVALDRPVIAFMGLLGPYVGLNWPRLTEEHRRLGFIACTCVAAVCTVVGAEIAVHSNARKAAGAKPAAPAPIKGE